MSSADPTVRPTALAAMKAGTDVVIVTTAATAVPIVDSEFTEKHVTADPGPWFSFDVATGKFTTLKKIKRLKVSFTATGVIGGAGDVMIFEVHKDGVAAGNHRVFMGASVVEQSVTLVDALTDVAKGSTISVMVTATLDDDQVTLSDCALLLESLELAAAG